MTLDHFVALLTAVALNANPSSHAIPSHIPAVPRVAGAQVSAPAVPPVKRKPESLGVATTAKSAIVVDVASGAVLFAKDANVPRPIASLTKVMTAMVVVDQGLKGDEMITILPEDFEREGRPIFAAGETFTRAEAFNDMLVGSVNEIANAFARTSPGGRAAFLEAMHAKADQLELAHATFLDPVGINRKNMASATDVAVMLRSALAYPEIREASSLGQRLQKTATRTVKVDPTNLLLTSYLNEKPYQIMVAKTGSLPEAGFCFAQVTKNPAGQQVIAVVLNSDNHFARFQEVKGLTAWAFDTYEWK